MVGGGGGGAAVQWFYYQWGILRQFEWGVSALPSSTTFPLEDYFRDHSQ
jgi:hypothetical protein